MPPIEFNTNVKECKSGVPIIYLMKKDPHLPFGDFTLSVLFREMHDHENHYVTNELEFDAESTPFVFEISVPECQTDQLLQDGHKLKPSSPEGQQSPAN